VYWYEWGHSDSPPPHQSPVLERQSGYILGTPFQREEEGEERLARRIRFDQSINTDMSELSSTISDLNSNISNLRFHFSEFSQQLAELNLQLSDLSSRLDRTQELLSRAAEVE
jgi:chromosome segregation ATPase